MERLRQKGDGVWDEWCLTCNFRNRDDLQGEMQDCPDSRDDREISSRLVFTEAPRGQWGQGTMFTVGCHLVLQKIINSGLFLI